jgi:hypothetical protein
MKLTESNPPGYKSRPLHITLLLTDLLGRVHSLILTPIWVALAVAAGWAWGAGWMFFQSTQTTHHDS